MATMDTAADTAELAASLTMEEIPMKLRCSVCSFLAVGAVRMPCCDQNICENCEASLNKECPVCLHASVDPELLKPNKTLRTTIKAFLKRRLMEKNSQRKREEAAKTSAAAASATSVITDTTENLHTQAGKTEVLDGCAAETDAMPPVPPLDYAAETDQGAHQTSIEAQMDIPRQSIENFSDTIHPDVQRVNGSKKEDEQADGVEDSGSMEQNGEVGEPQSSNGQWAMNGGSGIAMPNGALALNGANAAVPMDLSQMMQYMPGSMPSSLMGAFPNMMGIPGMGMDPMAMAQAMTQSMYGGFGGPGMGMNGMNMGMGFNAGQGALGGFNGQLDSWNAGQDNYNSNAYGANGTGGNFGAHAGHAGYNMSSHQGNFNQMHHQQYQNNDFHHGYNNHGYQNRGRGRRGYYNAGRGQGGYHALNQGNQNGHTNYEPFHHQLPAQNSQQGSIQQASTDDRPQTATQGDQYPDEAKVDHPTDAADILQADEERMNRELNPGDENDEPNTDVLPSNDVVKVEQNLKEPETNAERSGPTNESAEEAGLSEKLSEVKPLPIETFISSDDARMGKPRMPVTQMMNPSMPPPVGPTLPQGPAVRYSQETMQDQGGWARGGGRGYYRGRGEYRGRGASYQPHVNGIHSSSALPSPTTAAPAVAIAEPKGLGVEGAPTGPKALREGLPNSGLRGGRGFSIVGRAYAATHTKSSERARSRSPSTSRRRTRSRSPESSQHRSSHHRSHRHRSRSQSEDLEHDRRKERRHRRSRKYEDDENEDREESRHREASVESTSKKSTHRSHRHHHEKESGSSSHRHHRDRSRDRDRDHDEERRHRKKRSRSPLSVMQTPTSITVPELSNGQDKEDSRKRRDRERDDDDRHRERKRSRRDRSASPQEESRLSHRVRDREDKNDIKPSSESRRASLIENQSDRVQVSKPIPTGPKKPEKDHHTLEREARDRERLVKELQRRAATEGKGPKRSSGLEGRIGGRKLSYKYEDEEGEEARAKVEKEREAARWE